jgi:hypothetical protein
MDWTCHECGTYHDTIPAACSQCGTKPEIVLNVWRCPSCGKDEISGLATKCPQCGAEKGLDVESRVAADRAVQGDAVGLAAGKWFYCGYCDRQVPPFNPDTGKKHEVCPTCKGPLSDADREAATEFLSAEAAADYRKDATKKVGAEDPDAEVVVEEPGTSPPPERKSPIWLWIILIFIGVTGLGRGLYFLLHDKSASMVVESRRWHLAIDIERNGLVVEQTWRDAIPLGVLSGGCTSRVRSHRQIPAGTQQVQERVADGKTCASYGYKKKGGVSVKQCTKWDTKYSTVTKTKTVYKSVPVFSDWCTYTVRKWHKVRQVAESGTDDKPPSWPVVTGLAANERAGQRLAKFTLLTKSKDGAPTEINCKDQTQWEHYKKGSAVVAKKDGSEWKVAEK